MAKSTDNLVTLVLQDIRRKIIAWEYPFNYQLVEEELCDLYKVSRSPIRQALSHLEAEALVEKRPRKGYFVKQLHLEDVKELYELRFALETHIIRSLLNKGIPEETYLSLFKTWSEMTGSEDLTPTDLARLDESFHTSLAVTYGNQLILSQVKMVNERIFVFREIDFKHPGRLQETKEEHIKILTLFSKKDLNALEDILQKNIFSGLRNVESAMIQLINKSHYQRR